MSHMSTYSNNCLKNTNRARLLASLREIEVELDFDHKEVKSSWDNTTADASIIYKGKRIPAGLNFKTDAEGNETIEMVGDFYGTGLDQKAFTDKMAQYYQKNDIIAKCEDQKWYVDDAEDIKLNKKGEFVIQAYRYAE